MRLKIVQVGELVLRKPARPLSAAEIRMDETQDLIEHMRETMHDAPGVGLAAPQIGLPIQLAVIEDRDEYLKGVPPELLAEHERQAVPFLTLINPRIVSQSEEQVEYFEGCLSLAGYSALVRRSHSVVVEFVDPAGKPQQIAAQGWFARILQHEIDHLQGTMYIDRMEPRSLTTVENLSRYWRALPIARVREVLELG